MREKRNKGKSYSADEIMEILAKEIADESRIELENARSEAGELKIAPDHRLLKIAEDIDRKREIAHKRFIKQRRVRFAAVFMICFITLSAVTMGTSEAFRKRIFDLFGINKTNAVTLHPKTERDLIGDWTNYWYPEYMPEDFYLSDAVEDKKFLFYKNSNEDAYIRIFSTEEDEISCDSDAREYEHIQIGSYDAYIFSNNEGVYCTLICVTENGNFEIWWEGLIDLDEIAKIAENMNFIKK